MINTIVNLINALSSSNQLLIQIENDPNVPTDKKMLARLKIRENREAIHLASNEREVQHA